MGRAWINGALASASQLAFTGKVLAVFGRGAKHITGALHNVQYTETLVDADGYVIDSASFLRAMRYCNQAAFAEEIDGR